MRQVKSFLQQLWKRIDEADMLGLSAQLAYFFLLSLFPFLLFLVTLAGYLPIDSPSVIEVLHGYLPEEVIEMIERNIHELVENRSSGLLSIGILGTIWSASNGMNALTKSFNRAYHVAQDRSFFTTRIIAIVLTFAMIFVIGIALLLPVFGQLIGEKFFSMFQVSDVYLRLWNVLRWIISSLVFFIVFLVLYVLAPHTKVFVRHAVWGALFTTLVWQITSFCFSYYVNTFANYSATYGSLGTVIALMIWFYLSGIIITTGGVINVIVRDFLDE